MPVGGVIMGWGAVRETGGAGIGLDQVAASIVTVSFLLWNCST